jgi:diguanylate cyclase (GGDEF)-like protein
MAQSNLSRSTDPSLAVGWWRFMRLPLLLSVLLTELVVAQMSFFLRGQILGDFLLTGLVASVVVASLVGSVAFRRVNRLQAAEKLVAEKVARLDHMAASHQQAQQNLAQMANYDGVTGLPNRSLFQDRLNHGIARSERSGEMLALMLLDIDRFKHIKQTLGHNAGDVLLLTVAGRLEQAVLEDDTVARLGGDEFALILEGIADTEDVAAVAQKILDAFARPFALEGQEIFVTPSIGISIYPVDGDSPESLMKNADAAIGRAKDHGRNTYRFYTADMNARASERFSLESGLRRALERGEFLLHYQPQVDRQSGEVVAVEALLRWHHPERGLVGPNEFIPLLEETSLICPVGEWVLRTACTQGVAWQQAGLPALRIAVNLSAHQFRSQGLVERVGRILRETGLDPQLLELELTEGALMESTRATSTTLTMLKQLGVRIAIDDFGTGYSSLSYLKRFPIDKLKIDRSFVREITTDSNDAAIVRAVITMGHSLGLGIVAEGVESAEQLGFLNIQGCDEYQGFFFSRPIPAEEVVALLEAGQQLARSA